MRRRYSIVFGFFVVVSFVLFSYLVGGTSVIWYQTRILGLLSYLFLFLALNLGVLKALTNGVAPFGLFRFHIPASVAAVFFTFFHFISAFFDSFKWGYQLRFYQFFGFSFSDFWVSMLSLGVLSFYIMVFASVTSPPKVVRRLGFKSWKLIHFFSYLAFFMAYAHSMTLGTDVKTSLVAPFLSPLFFSSFTLTVGLLFARILKGFRLTTSLSESGLSVLFVVLLIVFVSDVVKRASLVQSVDMLSESRLDIQRQAIQSLESQIVLLKNETSVLNKMSSEVYDGAVG